MQTNSFKNSRRPMKFHTKPKTTSMRNNTSYSYHTQNQKNCYASSIQISVSGRIVHLISGAGRILKIAIRNISKRNCMC